MADDRARTPTGLVAAARRRVAGIEDLLGRIRNSTGDVHREVLALRTQVTGLQARLDELAAQRATEHERLVEILRIVAADEPAERRRLRAARETEAYELAFSDPDPLISVVIPTWDNHRQLGKRAIASALAQTYQNFEIVIVGDGAPPEAEQVAMSFGDPRIRYARRPLRGPYPDEVWMRWLVAGAPPANDATALARGRWIAPMADDDALRPEHFEVLLEGARRDRLELVYGRCAAHMPDGEPEILGSFPPRLGEIALQASLFHAELRFFELELSDALFGLPTDWGKVQRMMRAGVRIGMVDAVVVDYYPSRRFNTRGVEPW